jgi:hypothetical protein
VQRREEKRREKVGFSERGGEESISPILKVPRQCPLFLLVEVLHIIGIIFLYDVGKAAL